MHHLQQVLESIGLNHHESTIYLHLLERGERSASIVALATKIPRSTVRNILDKLCERGIVQKVYKRNTQFYTCKPPVALLQHLEHTIDATNRSVERIRDALPVFQSLHAKHTIVPKVQVFEGAEQVIEAFNRCLYQDPPISELLIFTSYEFLRNPLIRRNDDDFFIKVRVKKGIRARVLVGRTTESRKMARSVPRDLRERRFIPATFQLPGNIHVYGNCVMYFSASDDEYLAVLVESAMMAHTMRALFEFMWEVCGSSSWID